MSVRMSVRMWDVCEEVGCLRMWDVCEDMGMSVRMW